MVAVVHFAAQRVADARQLAAPGVAERPPQHAVFRPGYLAVTEGADRLPIPASREERRLRALEQQLKAQQQQLEQAKQRMIEMLA
ncbi:hypothetical protein [Erwinia amylovora]|uniref:hypothetical protein n=1 Tax=Erwinia amylovora TaxID=552 RepID=UPI001D07D5F5